MQDSWEEEGLYISTTVATFAAEEKTYSERKRLGRRTTNSRVNATPKNHTSRRETFSARPTAREEVENPDCEGQRC